MGAQSLTKPSVPICSYHHSEWNSAEQNILLNEMQWLNTVNIALHIHTPSARCSLSHIHTAQTLLVCAALKPTHLTLNIQLATRPENKWDILVHIQSDADKIRKSKVSFHFPFTKDNVSMILSFSNMYKLKKHWSKTVGLPPWQPN